MSSDRRGSALLEAFRYAFSGLLHVIQSQRNARVHGIATILVIVMSLWLGIDGQDWAILLLTIATVWLSECFNTALETIVDLSSPEYHPLARLGKDAAAGAVLIAAIFSVVIGLIILGPALVDKITMR